MIRKALLFLILVYSSINYGYAQSKSVTGTVTDAETAEPLIGVVVSIKGSTVGTQTDVNGKFKLNVPSTSTVLQLKYLGFITKEVAVGDKSDLKITLKQDLTNLNEVVVIGYGTVNRRDLTGSVGSIKGSEIEKTPVTSIAEALTGRIPGVQVTTVDGAPGAEIVIRVRGGGSVTQDNSPLYIVDGFIVDNISNIATTDIESIDVLKDASSTAIYGARGANGVVIVTTKSPKAGKTTISYNAYAQSKNFPRELDVLSPYEYVLAQYEYATLRGATSSELTNFTKYFGVYEDLELYKSQRGTNWQDELFGRSTVSQQQNLSISGGTDKTKLSFNTTYNKDEGLLQGSGVNRFYLNFKLNHEISKNLNLDLAARYSNNIVDGAGTSGGSSLRISDGITTRPVNGIADQILIDPASDDDDYDQFLKSLISPTALASQDYRKRTDKDLSLNGALSWKIIKPLTFRSEISTTLKMQQNKRFFGPLTGESRNVGGNLPLGELTNSQGQTYRFTNTLNYKFKKGKDHDFTFLLGQELLSGRGTQAFNRAKSFDVNLSPEVLFANMGLGTPDRSSTTEFRGENIISGFGRANYSYKGKYLLALTTRADWSSKFAPGKRLGIFPAASFAWRASEESFLQKFKTLSELKLRLSYGEAGNNRIANDSWRFLFGPSSTRSYGSGDISQPYYVTVNSSLPNPNLRWETTLTRGAGLDFGFFQNKLTGTFDYYWNTTKDLLVDNDIPAQTGFTSQLINIGQTSNRGVELSLNGIILDKKGVRLSASFNIGRNTPKIDKLDGNNIRAFSSNWAGTDLKTQDDYRLIVGQTIGLMYGYVSDGFYSADDFSSYNASTRSYVLKPGVPTSGALLGGTIGIRPGTLKLKDLDGDGLITADKDRQIIGSAVPKHSGGFGLNASYKGFDVSTFFNWVYGNDIYNTGKIAFNMYYRTTYGNLLNTVNYDSRFKYIDANGALVTDLAALGELNKGANIHSPFSSGNASPLFSSSAVEDGSFLRLTFVTLGYTVPKTVTSKFGMSSLRLYGTVYNAFILTNYSGYDPEVSATRNGSYAALTPGVDYSAYPKSRTFTLGLSVNF